MPWSLFDILYTLPVFALVLFRLGGLIMVAPVFGSSVIPIRIRAALTLGLAAMLFPVISRQAPANVSIGSVVAGGVGELMIGIIIGLSMTILISSMEVVGRVIGQQGGIALSESFDPNLSEESSVTGQVYTIVMVLTFLIVGGHRAMLAALLDTYEFIPMMTFTLDESIIVLLAQMLTSAFVLAIRLAGPVIIALLLATLAMGFLSRTIPQLNILTVGFTVRTMIMLASASVSLMLFHDVLVDAIADGLDVVRARFTVPLT